MHLYYITKHVADDFDRNTELLLANAIYFKGNWLVEFNESNTKDQCFYTKPNVCAEVVNMMYLQDKLKYGYISDINAQVFELLYKVLQFRENHNLNTWLSILC